MSPTCETWMESQVYLLVLPKLSYCSHVDIKPLTQSFECPNREIQLFKLKKKSLFWCKTFWHSCVLVAFQNVAEMIHYEKLFMAFIF